MLAAFQARAYLPVATFCTYLYGGFGSFYKASLGFDVEWSWPLPLSFSPLAGVEGCCYCQRRLLISEYSGRCDGRRGHYVNR